MKLIRVKLANSVKVGLSGTEATFFTDSEYDMELVNAVIIRIKNKRTGFSVSTSLFNCIYFNEAEAVNDVKADGGAPDPAQRGSKVKGK